MADQQHIDRLRAGMMVWNGWIQHHQGDDIDLSGADLSGAGLDSANLFGANLSGANLRDAILNWADLDSANLSGANLSGADLSSANLRSANLRGANLRGANLSDAILSYVDLGRADLSGAVMGLTVLTALDLRMTKGLETVRHESPSNIGIDTIYASQGQIPDAFLRQAGVPESFLEIMAAITNRPIEYYSCFISYSSQNQDFAERLYADLQSNGVRCWYAPEDMKIGDKIRARINESIRIHDKLLLVLSEQAITSNWVEYEVETALAKERRDARTVLFPVRLDTAILESTTAWAAHIQDTRHIGNFEEWKNHDTYTKAFERLLRDLKAEAVKETQ